MIYIKYGLARLGLAKFYTFQSVPGSITYFYRADLIRTQAQTLGTSWHWSNSNLSVYFYPIQIIAFASWRGESEMEKGEEHYQRRERESGVTLD